jgi:hypothetical protein
MYLSGSINYYKATHKDLDISVNVFADKYSFNELGICESGNNLKVYDLLLSMYNNCYNIDFFLETNYSSNKNNLSSFINKTNSIFRELYDNKEYRKNNNRIHLINKKTVILNDIINFHKSKPFDINKLKDLIFELYIISRIFKLECKDIVIYARLIHTKNIKKILKQFGFNIEIIKSTLIKTNISQYRVIKFPENFKFFPLEQSEGIFISEGKLVNTNKCYLRTNPNNLIRSEPINFDYYNPWLIKNKI